MNGLRTVFGAVFLCFSMFSYEAEGCDSSENVRKNLYDLTKKYDEKEVDDLIRAQAQCLRKTPHRLLQDTIEFAKEQDDAVTVAVLTQKFYREKLSRIRGVYKRSSTQEFVTGEILEAKAEALCKALRDHNDNDYAHVVAWHKKYGGDERELVKSAWLHAIAFNDAESAKILSYRLLDTEPNWFQENVTLGNTAKASFYAVIVVSALEFLYLRHR